MINFRKSKIFNILTRNYLTKAFSFYGISQIINGVTYFVLIVLYTELLPPTDFGKIALIWIFLVIISTLIDGRLNTAFSIRFYKLSKKENIKNIYSIFIYNLVVFFLVYLFFLLFPSLFQIISRVQMNISKLNVIFLLILTMIFGNFYTNILIVDKKPKNYFLIKLLFNVALIVSSLVYLVILKVGYMAYFEAYLISYFIVALVGLRFFIVNYKPYKNVLSLIRLKELLKIGLPLVPTGLLLMLLTWADRYILNLYFGLAIVGIYTVGYRFSGIIDSFIIAPFGQALSPILFQQFAQSPKEYKRTLSRVFKYYWLITAGIVIAYFSILKEVFIFFVGQKYMDGYNIVAIVLFGIVLWGITNLLGATVIMKEKTHKMLFITAASVVFNIILNFLLIPEYGMYGAAVATLLSYMLQFTIVFVYTQKLVFVKYDYGFIFKSIFISLFFLASVLYISYSKVNIIVAIISKLSILLLFIFIAYKYLGIKKVLGEF